MWEEEKYSHFNHFKEIKEDEINEAPSTQKQIKNKASKDKYSDSAKLNEKFEQELSSYTSKDFIKLKHKYWMNKEHINMF